MSDNNSKLVEALADIQKNLKAPKGQFNKFGKYNYRNCEDILEAVKPLLGSQILTISDDMVLIGDRIYVKATATISNGDNSMSVTAFAREAEDKKGMDDAQITGAASSYARKYALNGLFLIDDTKDADSAEPGSDQKSVRPETKELSDMDKQWIDAAKADPEVLNQIQDLTYKAFITKEINKIP